MENITSKKELAFKETQEAKKRAEYIDNTISAFINDDRHLNYKELIQAYACKYEKDCVMHSLAGDSLNAVKCAAKAEWIREMLGLDKDAKKTLHRINEEIAKYKEQGLM